jgi:cobaltochelatase CobS
MSTFKTIAVKMAELFPTWKETWSDENEWEVGVFDHPLLPTLDQFYRFQEDTALEVLSILEKPERNNVWLRGPTQCGKTTLMKALAAKMRRPYIEVNCHNRMTPASFLGKPRARAGETYFEYGVIVKWLRTPGAWLVLNEYDTLDADCMNALKSALEFPRRVCLTEHDDEMVYGHPLNRIIVTSNTQGRGDDSGLFVNVHVQSIADLARFNAFIEMDYMSNEDEVAMLLARFEPLILKLINEAEGDDAKQRARPHFEEVVKKMVVVANKSRLALKAGSTQRVVSTNDVITWAENYPIFSTAHHSARISFLNSYDEVAKKAVKEAIIVEFGNEDAEILNDAAAAARAADKAPDQSSV